MSNFQGTPANQFLRVSKHQAKIHMGQLIQVAVFDLKINGQDSIKTNEIMPLLATWVDLDIITLREVSHKEKEKYQYYLSFTEGN